MRIKRKIVKILRWTEKYTQTDMVYVAKGGFWMIVGKASILLFSMATMSAFAYWAPKETYGAFKYIDSIAAILVIFTLPGIGTALTRAVARGKDNLLLPCLKQRFRWGVFGLIASLGISFWYFAHQNLLLGSAFLITSLFIPFDKPLQLFQPFWQGKKRFAIQSKYSVGANIFASIVVIITVFLTNNLLLLITVYFSAQVIGRGFFFLLTLKKIGKKEAATEKDKKEALSFGKHLTLMESASIFANQIDHAVVWHLLGPVAVAIYAFARLPTLKITQLTPITALALPKLSEKNIKEMKGSILKKFLKLFWIFIPITIIYIIFAPFIYSILFPGYTESVLYAQVLALVLVFFPFMLLKTSLIAAMETKNLYIVQFTGPVLKLILFLILAPSLGIWGIIFSMLISELCSSALTLYFYQKI